MPQEKLFAEIKEEILALALSTSIFNCSNLPLPEILEDELQEVSMNCS